MVADGLPGRSGKSCSERWRIYLTPGVKQPKQEPFSDYEVAVIYLVRACACAACPRCVCV